MAALEPAAPRNAGKKPRARKHTFRLDMTPMVGLGFVLLSFFLFSATLSRPPVLPLSMPTLAPPDPERCIWQPSTMTIILGHGHRVYYYFGLYEPHDPGVAVPTLHTTDFSAQGIRRVLLARQRQLPEPVILIKAGQHARYQAMVAILDEMNITDQKKYALTELSAADRQLLAASALR